MIKIPIQTGCSLRHVLHSRAIVVALFLIMLILRAGPLSAMDPSAYSVPLKGNPGNIGTEKVSRYLISSSDEGFSLPDTAFQRVDGAASRGGRKLISISAGWINGRESALTPADLRDTRFLELESPAIRKAASRFSGSKNIIDDIERFVYGHITRKIAGIPLLPAADILENRSGDCTEHSILSIALLRASGIPARAMVGMIFCEEFEGLRNVFVYHMWVEAYTSGKWVLVDSTRPGEKQPNRYIAFTSHSLRTEAPLSYLKAIAAIKDLSVEIRSN